MAQVIMLRSLYTLLRTLPAHRLFLASKARSRAHAAGICPGN
jgi:hypothetical protein